MFSVVIRNVRKLAFAGFAVAAAWASPAAAQDAAELAVTAEVTKTCAVTTSPVAFGNVDVTSGFNDDATGSITVTCTAGTDWVASADAGNGADATVTARKMTGATATLNYGLYTDATRLINFGGANTLGGLSSGAAATRTIYGRVPAGQTSVPSGSYADSVTISLTY